MGKKNKNRDKASTSSEPSKKKRKSSSNSPPPSPEPRPVLKFDYQQMPLNHKKIFYINDDLGSMYRYIGVISWLRSLGSLAGSVSEGIGNLNWVAGQGDYPCVEIKVVHPNGSSARFIISKSNLYLFAFHAQKWFQFANSPFILTEGEGQRFTLLDKKFTGAYTTKPWEHVGPKDMIDAVDFLATRQPSEDMSSFVESCEVFYIHLCEAARFYPVESLICKSLAPPLTPGSFDKPPYEDEESLLVSAPGEASTSVADDVYSLVKADGPINLKTTNATPPYLERLIKKFSNLSKYWYAYSLTGKKCYTLRDQDGLKFHLRSVKSLRCTLALLCNINLDKLLEEYKNKISNHGIVTPSVYQQMEDRVRELQRQARVFVPKDSSQA